MKCVQKICPKDQLSEKIWGILKTQQEKNSEIAKQSEQDFIRGNTHDKQESKKLFNLLHMSSGIANSIDNELLYQLEKPKECVKENWQST